MERGLIALLNHGRSDIDCRKGDDFISGHCALPYHRREPYRTLSHRRLRHRAVSVVTSCGVSDPINLARSRTFSGRGKSALDHKRTCAVYQPMSAKCQQQTLRTDVAMS